MLPLNSEEQELASRLAMAQSTVPDNNTFQIKQALTGAGRAVMLLHPGFGVSSLTTTLDLLESLQTKRFISPFRDKGNYYEFDLL